MSNPDTGKRLLIVDDDESILDTSKMMLSALGYSVESAVSGETALALLRESPEPFDLIMTDLSMPDMDGRQLINKIQEQGFSGPIAVISGYAIETDDLPGNVVGVLMKPYRMKDLSEKVKSFLEK